jgi:hypothetical protein
MDSPQRSSVDSESEYSPSRSPPIRIPSSPQRRAYSRSPSPRRSVYSSRPSRKSTYSSSRSPPTRRPYSRSPSPVRRPYSRSLSPSRSPSHIDRELTARSPSPEVGKDIVQIRYADTSGTPHRLTLNQGVLEGTTAHDIPLVLAAQLAYQTDLPKLYFLCMPIYVEFPNSKRRTYWRYLSSDAIFKKFPAGTVIHLEISDNEPEESITRWLTNIDYSLSENGRYDVHSRRITKQLATVRAEIAENGLPANLSVYQGLYNLVREVLAADEDDYSSQSSQRSDESNSEEEPSLSKSQARRRERFGTSRRRSPSVDTELYGRSQSVSATEDAFTIEVDYIQPTETVVTTSVDIPYTESITMRDLILEAAYQLSQTTNLPEVYFLLLPVNLSQHSLDDVFHYPAMPKKLVFGSRDDTAKSVVKWENKLLAPHEDLAYIVAELTGNPRPPQPVHKYLLALAKSSKVVEEDSDSGSSDTESPSNAPETYFMLLPRVQLPKPTITKAYFLRQVVRETPRKKFTAVDVLTHLIALLQHNLPKLERMRLKLALQILTNVTATNTDLDNTLLQTARCVEAVYP